MDLAIATQQISKVYNPSRSWRHRSQNIPTTAVDEVTLSIPQGELFGLLGPNGAGKTTLVKILCTLILPSSGTASIVGTNLKEERKIRAATGLVVSNERSFYWRLSIEQNLNFFAAMHGLHGTNASSRVDTVLKDVGLLNRAQQRFSDLSGGMRQRLAIARALLHQPKVLFLDEPTRSLDPIATRQLHDLIRRVMAERNMTVFLITHDLSEAEKLCDRVALMHDARIRQVGRPEELRRYLNPQRNYTVTTAPLLDSQLLKLREQVSSLNYIQTGEMDQAGELQFHASEHDGDLTVVIDFLRTINVEIYAIEGAPPSLEDVFAYYTSDLSESEK